MAQGVFTRRSSPITTRFHHFIGQLKASLAQDYRAGGVYPVEVFPQAEEKGQGRRYNSSARPNSKDSGCEKQVLYKGRGIKFFRLIVRTKILQFGGVSALALPLWSASASGKVIQVGGGTAGLLVVGSVIGASTLWFFSRRYLGELSLIRYEPENPGLSVIRVSALDFWGHREDVDVSVHQIVPPFRGLSAAGVSELVNRPCFPLEIGDSNRQYIMSLRYGIIENRQLLQKLLYGTWHEDHEGKHNDTKQM